MPRTSPKKTDALNPVEMVIDTLVEGGDGMGRVGEQVCFVPYTAPGDCVRVRIVHSGKRFLRGAVVDILEPGPERREAPCPLYRACGGCNWLHLNESEQLRAKAGILAHALGVEIAAVVPSPKSSGYRGRARLHFSFSKTGEGRLGFVRADGQGIADVIECPILEPRLNQCIAALRTALAEERDLKGEIRLANGRGKAAVCVSLETPAPPSLYRTLTTLPESLFSGVMLSVGSIAAVLQGGPFCEIDAADDKPFRFPAASFGQANAGVNRLLSETIRQWISKRRFRKMAELFSGAANLTIAVAPFVESGIVSELDKDACPAASFNLKERGFSHVQVRQGDAFDTYRKLTGDFDLLVLNPPRTGHLELARAVAAGRHKAVLYVSCNPSTLARDIAELRRAGYEMKEIMGFDMFPETSHMETAVLLECSNK